MSDHPGPLPDKTKDILIRIAAVLLALAVWQLAAMLIDSSILLVTPVEVIRRACTLWREDGFWSVIGFTFAHIAAGYVLAVTAGTALAFLSAKSQAAEILLRPWAVSFRTVPVASMVVIFLIWVSAKNLSVIISFLVVFPVIYGNVLTGLKNLDGSLREMARVFRISFLKELRYIILPQLRPGLLNACSVTAGMAWKAGIAAEIIGTPAGSVGKMIYQSKIWLDTDDLFAWTLVLVLLSLIFEKAVVALLKKALG